MNTLTNKRVILGVCGSIAAYKSPDIVRRLQRLGAEVRVVITNGGREFVSERSLQTISRNKVHDNLGTYRVSKMGRCSNHSASVC